MDYELAKLDSMCWSLRFEEQQAKDLLRKIDPNQTYDAVSRYTKLTYRTTLLEQAVNGQNVAMVRLLLENGADPNFVDPEGEADPVFWDLQYPGDTEEENNIRLEIAQIMLEYGASPTLVWEDDELLSFLRYFVYYDIYDEMWEYKSKFFILLIAYGGSNRECDPTIYMEFDKAKMEKYKFQMVYNDQGKPNYGMIVDHNGKKVAVV